MPLLGPAVVPGLSLLSRRNGTAWSSTRCHPAPQPIKEKERIRLDNPAARIITLEAVRSYQQDDTEDDTHDDQGPAESEPERRTCGGRPICGR
jgi:hypothetical protein